MTEYAFPRDLPDAIKTRWQTAADQQFELPEDRILQKLLETCYHASFRTSEQRMVQCVVAYASMADIPEGTLRLSRPVVLTDSELVRLSPVTQHRQTVIGCEQMDGWLRIWGFFDDGHAWVQHSAGDPPAVPIQLADFPPDCLTITIEAPVRHQSVFSVCHNCEQAIGLIVSQDGDVKAVKADGGRLMFCDGILD
jgi:hypothetical protein